MNFQTNKIFRIFAIIALTILPAFSIFTGSANLAFANSTASVITSNGFKVQAGQIQISQVLTSPAVYVNDPGFTEDYTNTNAQWGLIKADFPQAWNLSKGSSNVVVAVIDTGIDGHHEDLSSGQVGPGYNFLNNTYIPIGADSDDNGHGTLVAGIIGATVNNFRGIAGTNWNVTLMPLKALDSTGSGNSENVAAAIKWAADHGANIINLSLGGVGYQNDTTLSDAVTYAYDKNVVIVAAAGNDTNGTGIDLDNAPVFPVCDKNGQNMVIGVAATDNNDLKADFSNYGKACVDVSAPGKRILSTINFDPTTHQPLENGYAYGSGTSLATPFVSGEAALIKALYPSESNSQIRDRIILSADNIDALNTTQCAGSSCAGMLGSGRINAAAALAPNLTNVTIPDGTLAVANNSPQVYLISGGQKLPISQFVLGQRFSGQTPQTVAAYILDNFPTGPYAAPLDGTIVKVQTSPTLFEMISGFKRPVTYQVWQMEKFNPSQIQILSAPEMGSWPTTTFLPPPDGILLKDAHSPTVYYVINGLLHPINRGFYLQRGLNLFPIVILNGNDLQGYAQGNPFIYNP